MKQFEIRFTDLIPEKQNELINLCGLILDKNINTNTVSTDPLITLYFEEESDIFRVSEIDWDTENDGETPSAASLNLPDELVIHARDLKFDDDPVDIDRETLIDRIADYLSDTYGYCVIGFSVEDDDT